MLGAIIPAITGIRDRYNVCMHVMPVCIVEPESAQPTAMPLGYRQRFIYSVCVEARPLQWHVVLSTFCCYKSTVHYITDEWDAAVVTLVIPCQYPVLGSRDQGLRVLGALGSSL